VNRDDIFQERMILFLAHLIGNSTQPAARTVKAICRQRRLDRKSLEGLAMYALAKSWIKIEPVGTARIHSITRLGRQAYEGLKRGA
jgi:hypothetical protein